MNVKTGRNILVALAIIAAAWLTFPKNHSKDDDPILHLDAAEFMEAVQDTTIILVDVRTAGEHAEGCIPHTRYNIDVMQKDFSQQASQLLPHGATVAIYCRSGNRSKKAADILASKGYKVIELHTGYNGWVKWNSK